MILSVLIYNHNGRKSKIKLPSTPTPPLVSYILQKMFLGLKCPSSPHPDLSESSCFSSNIWIWFCIFSMKEVGSLTFTVWVYFQQWWSELKETLSIQNNPHSTDLVRTGRGQLIEKFKHLPTLVILNRKFCCETSLRKTDTQSREMEGSQLQELSPKNVECVPIINPWYICKMFWKNKPSTHTITETEIN